LVDIHFPDAVLISAVQDNLNTYTPAALYEAFTRAAVRRVISKLDVRYTPKHGSWLNMAECELAVLLGQCLDQRIPNIPSVRNKTTAWEQRRNTAKATVNWRFTSDAARTKLQRLYPS
jgi:hypothetical protein